MIWEKLPLPLVLLLILTLFVKFTSFHLTSVIVCSRGLRLGADSHPPQPRQTKKVWSLQQVRTTVRIRNQLLVREERLTSRMNLPQS